MDASWQVVSILCNGRKSNGITVQKKYDMLTWLKTDNLKIELTNFVRQTRKH